MAREPGSVHHRDGLMWMVREHSDDHIGPGPHEHGLHRRLASFLSADSLFVDAGAHVGHYSLRLADHCTRVVAIEPNPRAREQLCRNVQLNRLGNVDVLGFAAHHREVDLRLWDPFNVTAGSCTRTLSADESPGPPAGYGMATMFFDDGFGKFLGSAEARTIDFMVEPYDEPVALLKIDVEGNEGNVLAGAVRTMTRDRPTIFIEMHHSMYGHDIWTAVVEQLTTLGYEWDLVALPQRSAMTALDKNEFIYAEPVSRGLREFIL